MELNYSHSHAGETIARNLREIDHTENRPRFFTAFGLEDLYNFDDKLSSVTGTILIAVDGYESDSTDNGYDSLNDQRTYSFIIAGSTSSAQPSTIDQAIIKCRDLAKQIRNYLFHYPGVKDFIDHNTQITGIGPIGDNFYGVILTFTVNEIESYIINSDFWKN